MLKESLGGKICLLSRGLWKHPSETCPHFFSSQNPWQLSLHRDWAAIFFNPKKRLSDFREVFRRCHKTQTEEGQETPTLPSSWYKYTDLFTPHSCVPWYGPTLQTRKQRLREVQPLAQSHIAPSRAWIQIRVSGAAEGQALFPCHQSSSLGRGMAKECQACGLF